MKPKTIFIVLLIAFLIVSLVPSVLAESSNNLTVVNTRSGSYSLPVPVLRLPDLPIFTLVTVSEAPVPELSNWHSSRFVPDDPGWLDRSGKYYKEGIVQLFRGNLTLALMRFQTVIEEYPETDWFIPSRFWQGQIFAQRQKYAQSAKSLNLFLNSLKQSRHSERYIDFQDFSRYTLAWLTFKQYKFNEVNDIINILIPRLKTKNPEYDYLFYNSIEYLINPTGKFVIGGPHGDTGLTGRKIIVDTYGGKGAHGGGAFSGKDPSKVDRSGAYAARHIAKNLVAAGVSEEVLVQLSYAIGVAEPVALYINTYGTSNIDVDDGEIAKMISGLFDLRPFMLVKYFGLKKPIYQETATYGHMGREPETINKTFFTSDGKKIHLDLELFNWEKLDYVEKIKNLFNL